MVKNRVTCHFSLQIYILFTNTKDFSKKINKNRQNIIIFVIISIKMRQNRAFLISDVYMTGEISKYTIKFALVDEKCYFCGN